MTLKTTSYRKPSLLVTVTLFVGLGFVATTVTQAAEPYNIMSFNDNSTQIEKSDGWLQSIRGLDLANKLKNWRPKITPSDSGEGIHLARPFGKKGATLQFSSSLPDSVQRSLSESSDNHLNGGGYDTDVYVFIQKRW